MKVIVIGGVAAGMKAASKIMRLDSSAGVTVIEKGKHLSFAGCGLPYHVSGVIADEKELMTTAAGTLRDAGFFLKVKNVGVRNLTEAIAIDRHQKCVRVKDLTTGHEEELPYDRLLLATGAEPLRLPVPGLDLGNVFSLHRVEDAAAMKAALGAKVSEAVVIGGGLIGVEAVEALHSAGVKVTLLERLDQILPFLDWEISQLVQNHLKSKGVEVRTLTTVTALAGKVNVEAVETDQGVFKAGLVVVAAGVRPRVELAKSAGLSIGPTGAIRTNAQMQTEDPDIFAAGDCAETVHRVTGKPCWLPLGSTANKQGRVAAMNICGRTDAFPGILKTSVCKVFDYAVGSTGLSEKEARAAGYDVSTVLAPSPDRAHYYPGAKPIMIKLVAEAKNRRLLGAQIVGPGQADKRIDVAATAITAGMTVDEIAELDLCYAPPYSNAMDPIITAANVARNKLDGGFLSLTPMEVKSRLDRKEDFVFLDVRSPKEFEAAHIEGALLMPLGELREKCRQLPVDTEIVTFCKISLRGYEAALILKAHGFKNVSVMDGGMLMWPYNVEKAAA
ncbi:MAG: FAD-dependent oxidoreductase [Candidatus Omnitrophica bacterium]|nr:FAD-dependent oxidoreductase [Candidatus Omnitrophota bacterium]